METFGDKMKALRESKGWTQKYTAEKMDVSPQMYNNYEKNKTNPSLEILKRICDLYNINLDTLDSKYDNVDDFLHSVELDNSYFENPENSEENNLLEEYPYIIPHFAGIGYVPLFHADLYNDQIDYNEKEYFFFENTDTEYSPGRLKKNDLLYCEGIDHNKEPNSLSVYLIYLINENRYCIRKFLDSQWMRGIIKGLKDSSQKKLLENISDSEMKDNYFLMTNHPEQANMSVVKKDDVKIIGHLQYVIFSPDVDLFESLGINYKELAQKKLDQDFVKIREKIEQKRKHNPDFLK